MNQKGPKNQKRIDPTQTFEGLESILKDLTTSLKDDLGAGMLEDAAYQTNFSKVSPLEKTGNKPKPEAGKENSMTKRIFGEKLLIDLGIERKKKEADEKKAQEAIQIEQLSAEIKHAAELQEAKIEGATEQLVETQIELAKEEDFFTTASVEQKPQRRGIAGLVFEKLRLKWLRIKIDSSKTWMQAGQGKRERAATGMEVFVKGKQMQGLEQQVWQHQG